MWNILNMEFLPDFVIVQTWNDGPEAHNMGNLWPEQNTDLQPAFYMEDHSRWQPLITAFIDAYHKGQNQQSMLPSSGNIEGAMWYRTLPVDAICPFDDGIIHGSEAYAFWEKPFGFDSAGDTLNWAVVVAPGSVGSTLIIYSGYDGSEGSDTGANQVGPPITLSSQGLNYGSITNRAPGPQYSKCQLFGALFPVLVDLRDIIHE